MRFLLGLARTLVALCLGVWIGGLAFFGAITAAIMFPMTRRAGVPELAPLMVGPMLSRFALVCTACSLFIVMGWLLDGALTRRAAWWRAQGALSLAAVALGAYLNFGLLPQVERDQSVVIPIYAASLRPHASLSPEQRQIKARFDAGHALFGQWSRLNLWLLVGALACLMARTLPDVGEHQKA